MDDMLDNKKHGRMHSLQVKAWTPKADRTDGKARRNPVMCSCGDLELKTIGFPDLDINLLEGRTLPWRE